MKKVVKSALARIWVVCAALAGHKNRMPVLCYHSLNAGYDSDVEPLDPAMFEQHILFLKEHYTIARLSDLGTALKTGQALPQRSVVLTFDDGYLDNYETLFPILKKHDVPATIFLVSGFVDGRVRLKGAESWNAMNWQQAREMRDSGLVDFGGHTDSHEILTDLDDDEAVREVTQSCDMIAEKLGAKVTLFAYPFGQGQHIAQSAIDALRAYDGMLCACSTFWRTTHRPSQRFLINRVIIGPQDGVDDLALKVRGGYDYIYYWQKFRAFVSAVIKHKGVWR